jgi:hypothetical protein
VGGKQKRIKRINPLIEGVPQDEFIRRNADSIWLHQNERWESLPNEKNDDNTEIDIPF